MHTSPDYQTACTFMQSPPACFFLPEDPDAAVWPADTVRERLGWEIDVDWYLTLCELEQCGWYRADPRGQAFWESHGPDCLGDDCPTCASYAHYISAEGIAELVDVAEHLRAVPQQGEGICPWFLTLRAHLRAACQGEEHDGSAS